MPTIKIPRALLEEMFYNLKIILSIIRVLEFLLVAVHCYEGAAITVTTASRLAAARHDKYADASRKLSRYHRLCCVTDLINLIFMLGIEGNVSPEFNYLFLSLQIMYRCRKGVDMAELLLSY